MQCASAHLVDMEMLCRQKPGLSNMLGPGLSAKESCNSGAETKLEA